MDPSDWGETVRDMFSPGDGVGIEGAEAVQFFGDESVRIVSPARKEQAAYIESDDPRFDPSHERCRQCSHFIEGGACEVVRGPIDEEAYCGEYFADLTASFHEHPDGIEVNRLEYGTHFDWELTDLESLWVSLREELQRVIRRMRESEDR